MILEMRHWLDESKDERIAWFIQAIENVVYQDKPLPPFPQRQMFTKYQSGRN
jgi:hypothetical protein